MSLTKFTESTNIISELDDQPSLTATELKAKFDEAGGKIKTYLNNTLTTETEQLVATEKTSLQNSISSLSTSTTASINELRTSENAMIGDGYSTTQSYKIGDLCIYNNVLYRCITAIDEGESWNSSHWEQTNLGDEVRKSEVYSIEEVDTGKIWVDGKKIYRRVYCGHRNESDDTHFNVPIGFDTWKDVVNLNGSVYLFTGNTVPIPGTLLNQTTINVIPLIILGKEADWNPNSFYITPSKMEDKVKDYIIIFEYTKTTD